MKKDDRFNPYDIILETPTKLHLRLNRFHRGMNFGLTVLLPLFIIAMLIISIYFLMDENETDNIWLLLLVLVAPIMLMLAPSWPLVKMENGKVEVWQKRFFNSKSITYVVAHDSHLDVQWKRAYKTAAWEFLLLDNTGKRIVMFAIPDAPFNRRLREKENVLTALKKYCQPRTAMDY